MKLRVEGAIVGYSLLTGFEFDPAMPYSYCRLCGAVFQSARDRNPYDYATDSTPYEQVIVDNLVRRRDWSFRHSRRHPQREHERLERSGLFLTPEAFEKLAPFGIVPFVDLVLDDEIADAGRLAFRHPHDDVEQ